MLLIMDREFTHQVQKKTGIQPSHTCPYGSPRPSGKSCGSAPGVVFAPPLPRGCVVIRHSGESRHPGLIKLNKIKHWIPAFAGIDPGAVKNESLGNYNRVAADPGMLPEGATGAVFPLNLPAPPPIARPARPPSFKPTPKGILILQGRAEAIPLLQRSALAPLMSDLKAAKFAPKFGLDIFWGLWYENDDLNT